MTGAPPPHLLRELRDAASRKARRLKPLQVGETFFYQPRDPALPGEPVTVVRAPRLDVQNPSVRIRFEDGSEQSVPPQRLKVLPPSPKLTVALPPPPEQDPPLVQDARARPAWKRLLALLDQLHDADSSGQPREALDDAVRHRAAQLAGMISPRGASREEKAALAAQLRTYAELDAARRRAAAPGRAGKPPPKAEPLPAPTADTPEWLDQQQRRMLNAVAKSIHLRYFISDRDPRETVHVPRHVRQAIRDAGRSEGGLPEQPAARAPRGSELHRQAADTYREMVATALDVCQLLAVGKDREARALLEEQQRHRVTYALAQRQIEALRPQLHTGRFFHGDILSVREEHAEYDEAGAFVCYHGMTQYYTRLTVIYAEDGHRVTVANAQELESRTATRAGDDAWRDLCRWIEDMSERREGKRQGRRQDDDGTLIYRENEGSLRLRESIQVRYPRLPAALEVIRRSLETSGNDVLDSEIPRDEKHPARGYHEYQHEGKKDAS
ncbi:hypothetical protein SAMN04488058_101316 [Deinococcus reticulitermitis]|uniref:Uncharacterized protein n=1 Tax=Deinococcus reticulitermitis TaxID=856736 RepID=A0A1H6SSG8_9DEIO|nr:hypothetical protein [Deinococcus reticulitermitis]SEI67727.1 hypothetical protein SAMN04488058_101316 [Deinococcus reticulitermitis]